MVTGKCRVVERLAAEDFLTRFAGVNCRTSCVTGSTTLNAHGW